MEMEEEEEEGVERLPTQAVLLLSAAGAGSASDGDGLRFSMAVLMAIGMRREGTLGGARPGRAGKGGSGGLEFTLTGAGVPSLTPVGVGAAAAAALACTKLAKTWRLLRRTVDGRRAMGGGD